MCEHGHGKYTKEASGLYRSGSDEINQAQRWDKQRKVGGGTDKRGFNEVGGEQKPEWTE